MLEKLKRIPNTDTDYPGVESWSPDNSTLMSKINEIIEAVNRLEKPEHNHVWVDYRYEGAWSATFSPPNKKCTVCLATARF